MTLVHVHWPLYTVFPISSIFFWTTYLLLRSVPRLQPELYTRWNHFNQRCYAQNVNSVAHTLLVVGSLFAVLIGEHEVRDAGLRPYYSKVAYFDVSVSLGYFSFALPWSCHMYFWLGARAPYTRFSLCVHHALVFTAEGVYLLTQYCPWYGALALALMEFTNWFYVPHVLLTQLGRRGMAWTVIGILFVLAYTGCRVVACTYLAVVFARDVAEYEPHQETSWWVPVGLSLGCFYGLLGLSFFWFYKDLVPNAHIELKALFGDDYLLCCCPGSVRELIARNSPEAREKRKKAAAQMRMVREMQRANAAEKGTAGSDEAVVQAREVGSKVAAAGGVEQSCSST